MAEVPTTGVETLEFAVKGVCKICRERGIDQPFVFIFEEKPQSSAEAKRLVEDANLSFNCPGGGISPHVELNPLHRNVDFGDFEVIEHVSDPENTDAAVIKRLIDRYGKDSLFVISPIAGFDFPVMPRDVSHLGFGEFGNDTHLFMRNDLPSERRIYVRRER